MAARSGESANRLYVTAGVKAIRWEPIARASAFGGWLFLKHRWLDDRFDLSCRHVVDEPGDAHLQRLDPGGDDVSGDLPMIGDPTVRSSYPMVQVMAKNRRDA